MLSTLDDTADNLLLGRHKLDGEFTASVPAGPKMGSGGLHSSGEESSDATRCHVYFPTPDSARIHALSISGHTGSKTVLGVAKMLEPK